METLIEILGYQLYRNVINPLCFDFERVVYLVENNTKIEHKMKTLESFLKIHGVKEVHFVFVKKHEESIFAEIRANYPDAYYNCFTGSGSLHLMMTLQCEKNHQRFYTYDFLNDDFKNFNNCDQLLKRKKLIHLSIEDIIYLADGEIRKTAHQFPAKTRG